MNSNSGNVDQEEDLSQVHLTSTRVITWKIRNFEDLPDDVDYSLDSAPFVYENATWCLRLYPNAEGTYLNRAEAARAEVLDGLQEMQDAYPYVGLTIVRLQSSVPRHQLLCNLIWREGSLVNYFLAVNFDEDHKEHGNMNFIDFEVLEDSDSFDTGIFTLICHMSSYRSCHVDASCQTENLMQSEKALGDLCQDFKNLFINGQDHDVVLKVKNREFRAHRNVLRSRSPVLEAMLSHDMIENSSGMVDIPDCEPGAFEQFLLYLYGAEVETLDSDNMLALYYIADKYGMASLREECREFAKKSLTSNNISDVIQLAVSHSDAELLQCATDYFVREINEILPTEQWQSYLKRNTAHGNELIIKAVMTLSNGRT